MFSNQSVLWRPWEATIPYSSSDRGVKNVHWIDASPKNLLYIMLGRETYSVIGSQTLTRDTLHNYQVENARLSEVKLSDTGSRNIKVPGAGSHYWFYHSGPETLG